jgi:predicted esterase
MNLKVTRACAAVMFLLLIAPTARAEKAKPFVFVPSKGDGTFPVAVWLHGYRGYTPDGYFRGATPAAMQKHADDIGAIILGFPATADLGDDTQQWSEEPAADHAYVQAMIKELVGKNPKADVSRVALFGFSQGAMVAGDLATHYPESYAGAVLMSPGGIGRPKVAKTRTPAHAKQVFFCFCGAEEHPGTVRLTQAYAQHFEKVLGAKVTLKLYPGVDKHDRPPDFAEKFPEWMTAIFKRDGKP